MSYLIKEINSGDWVEQIPENGIAVLTETIDDALEFDTSDEAFQAGNKIVIQEGQEFWVVDIDARVGGGLIGLIEGASGGTGGSGTSHPPNP